jgi:hypothetical protein
LAEPAAIKLDLIKQRDGDCRVSGRKPKPPQPQRGARSEENEIEAAPDLAALYGSDHSQGA